MSSWTSWPARFTLSATEDIAKVFPNLTPQHCVGDVSAATRSYNCFAWAAVVTSVRWEPDPFFQYYWPAGVDREYTIEAFEKAYMTERFEVCADGVVETGVEKICIYTLNGSPTHAARQLQNGNWTTKFGDMEDVEHIDLECLIGPIYGQIAMFMKRNIK